MELVTILANYAFGKHNSELVIFKLAIQLLTSLFLSLSDELCVEPVLMVWVQGTVNHSNRNVFHFYR